jgi:aminodeoxyfutalosine synthase
MLADGLRRRLHGAAVTFVRVAMCPLEESFANAVPPAALEVRITGSPETAAIAESAVKTAKEVAGQRTVAAFAWEDIERLSAGAAPRRLLEQLRAAGLEAIAELPLDTIPDPVAAVRDLKAAGFERLRLGVARSAAAERTSLLIRAAELQHEFGCIHSLNPLPSVLSTFRPTTGYEDVKMVAIARLAAPEIPSIQVDWQRYGPKLAQVALTFGADDLYGVSASDEAPEGRRRAPLEEVRRNVDAAGFAAVERDGRFRRASGG